MGNVSLCYRPGVQSVPNQLALMSPRCIVMDVFLTEAWKECAAAVSKGAPPPSKRRRTQSSPESNVSTSTAVHADTTVLMQHVVDEEWSFFTTCLRQSRHRRRIMATKEYQFSWTMEEAVYGCSQFYPPFPFFSSTHHVDQGRKFVLPILEFVRIL